LADGNTKALTENLRAVFNYTAGVTTTIVVSPLTTIAANGLLNADNSLISGKTATDVNAANSSGLGISFDATNGLIQIT
jgi:hypothetical protein